ncbi:MAG: hypothetical protein JHD02_00615, partial [Thermoleophilaceae bacterium]|nr:hypothetical protein [Thermoleophilaceae bacterium]
YAAGSGQLNPLGVMAAAGFLVPALITAVVLVAAGLLAGRVNGLRTTTG